MIEHDVSSSTSLALEILPPLDYYGRVTVEEPAHVQNVRFWGASQIGAFSYFSVGCEVTNAEVGRYCSVGQQVLIGPGEHATSFVTTHPIAVDPSGIVCGMHDSSIYRSFALTDCANLQSHRTMPMVGNDVWIGARAIIMRGVVIGDGAVIGAGSIVTHDVPSYAIAAGVPARVIKDRFAPHVAEQLKASCWWLRDLSRIAKRDFSDPLAFLEELQRSDPPLYEARVNIYER